MLQLNYWRGQIDAWPLSRNIGRPPPRIDASAFNRRPIPIIGASLILLECLFWNVCSVVSLLDRTLLWIINSHWFTTV